MPARVEAAIPIIGGLERGLRPAPTFVRVALTPFPMFPPAKSKSTDFAGGNKKTNKVLFVSVCF